MSGIRVLDAELLELGLTLPGFVERSQVIASLPSLGLLTLAGIDADQHTYQYIEVGDIRDVDTPPDGFDLVAISSFSAQMFEGYALADRYRAMGVPVVLGGLHVTAEPAEAAEHADAVVIGEGEAVWSQVLDDAARNQLQPYYRSDGRFDLADSPLPAYHLLDVEKYNRLTVSTSRGCPFRCEFCGSSVLLTDRYKIKPIDRVLQEIDAIVALWKRPFIEFADDNAFVNKAYWSDLLDGLAERNMRWFAETDLSIWEDSQLLTKMRNSGCYEVLIGLESPEPAGLRGLELKADWKAEQWPRYIEAIRTIQSHGIRVNGCFVIGLDGQTQEIFDLVDRFVTESELFDVQITYPTPFPGTPLYQRWHEAGRLLEDRAWDRCTLFDINFEPRDMSSEQLRDGFHRLVRHFYSEEQTQRRRDNFKENYLRPRKQAPRS